MSDKFWFRLLLIVFVVMLAFVVFASVRSYQIGYAEGECDALGGLAVEDGWGYACIEKLR